MGKAGKIIRDDQLLEEIQGENLRKSVFDFRFRIKTELHFTGQKTMFFPGGQTDVGDSYIMQTSLGRLKITIVPDAEGRNRFMHYINLNQDDSVTSSDFEINFPKGHDNRAGTLLATKNGKRFICSRGRVTVYMGALKRSTVINYFEENFRSIDTILENGQYVPLIMVADLDSIYLFEQIATFTHQIKEFKKEFRK